jgi:hypothetical protein
MQKQHEEEAARILRQTEPERSATSINVSVVWDLVNQHGSEIEEEKAVY